MSDANEAGKATKPFYKKWWGILGISFFALVLLGAIVGKNNPSSHLSSAQNTEQSTTTETTPEKPKGKIDMEHFQMLKTGMTKAEVDEILGESGELQSSNELADIKTELYIYKNFTKVVTVMFQNNKMNMKSQAGL